MKTTQSQQAIMETVTDGLLNREVVCMWGTQPNGKSHIFHRLVGEFSVGLYGKDHTKISSRRVGEYTIDILDGVEAPTRGDRYAVVRLRRQILESYNIRLRNGLNAHRQFMQLLLDLNDARTIPTLAMDEIQIIPKGAFHVYKIFNQLRHKNVRIGPAALLSGTFTRRRMPDYFWPFVKEIQIGKVSVSEIEEFIAFLAPAHKDRFTRAVHQRLTECSSTLEMSRIVRNSIEYWRKHSRDKKIDMPIVKAVSDKLLYAKHRIAA